MKRGNRVPTKSTGTRPTAAASSSGRFTATSRSSVPNYNLFRTANSGGRTFTAYASDSDDDDPLFEHFGMTRDPFELFREFFSNAGIDNVMGGGFFDLRGGQNGSIAGMASGPYPPARSSGNAGTIRPINVSSTRVSTQIINGRTITTKTVVENGTETVTTFDNGKVLNQTSRSSNQGALP
ncbi:hypothetical protein RvY_03287-2 [Ramazzottius varieornatus]|uniref:Uncharacterized protein n=1 Tax=Ramazzottius varieornatus TaxID=947166 RepID=A0A1D1UXR1_RAMVA|nr:hypothetical protein RvY_03287-2 [Ramazzottius varieornatus]